MVTVENNAGRLVEIRLPIRSSRNDAHELQGKLLKLFDRMPGRVVICTHMVGEGILPPESAEVHATILRRDNPRVERAALVAPPDQPALAAQIERLIEGASHAGRKLCRTDTEAETWLAPALSGVERMRLRAFLSSRKPEGEAIPSSKGRLPR